MFLPNSDHPPSNTGVVVLQVLTIPSNSCYSQLITVKLNTVEPCKKDSFEKGMGHQVLEVCWKYFVGKAPKISDKDIDESALPHWPLSFDRKKGYRFDTRHCDCPLAGENVNT